MAWMFEKITSVTISIRYLLVLRSFWVVTWPVYNNFECGAKKGQKWPKVAKMAEKGPKWLKMTEIDWFDVVTALADQFWVPVQISSSSEAGLAKNLSFGTVKFFLWKAATDHISSFSFLQNVKFLRNRTKSEDMFFSQKMMFCPGPFLDILGQFLQFLGHFLPSYQNSFLTWLF